MAKKHYVKDEELGGIEREYVESDKKAKVDDYVVNINDQYCDARIIGVIYIQDSGILYGLNVLDEEDWTRYYLREGKYRTLIPTGNVLIDGEVFRMVNRAARKDEQIISIDFQGVEPVSKGDVYNVSLVEEDGIGTYEGLYFTEVDEYRVLEPQEGAKSDKTTADLLANLSREVVRLRKNVATLEEQADSNAKDIVTFAEELTEHKAEHGRGRLAGKFETLEERLQRADAEDLAHNVARFVSDYLKEGLRYERNN